MVIPSVFISGMVELTLVTHNNSCAIYRFVLGIIISPYHQHADDTLPHVGRKLGGANIIEVQDSPNGGVDWEPKANMEGNFIKSYLVHASRQYSFALFGKPGLNPRQKRIQFTQTIQIALSHDIKLLFKGSTSVYLSISLVVRRFILKGRFLKRGIRELVNFVSHV